MLQKSFLIASSRAHIGRKLLAPNVRTDISIIVTSLFIFAVIIHLWGRWQPRNGMNTEQQQIANDKQQRLDYQILEDLLEQISIGADSQESNFHKYGKQGNKEGLRY